MPVPGAALRPIAFERLDGWGADDHRAALACFLHSTERLDSVPLRPGVQPDPRLHAAAAAALRSPPADERAFFEAFFEAHEIVPADGTGLLTGYYEPEIEGRLAPEGRFSVPLLGRPADLVSDGPGLPAGYVAGRRTAKGLVPYFERAEIEAGALAGRGLEIVYVADPVDAFFAQVQGSVRIRLPDRSLRLRYAARNGHPYTAIGKVVVDAGLMRREDVTMQALRAWLADHPAEMPHVLRQNKSFVFFAVDEALRPADGPRGGAGVPLTAGRSLAVDRKLWSYGLPFFVRCRVPRAAGGEDDFARLLVAQDTGSAILGPARGDLFVGSGASAGQIAGLLKAEARFFVLLPRGGAR